MKVLGPKPLRLPGGLSDYRELRHRGLTYVDKTAFVASVLEGDVVTGLFPRPRRFGKTLNLSTLRYFLERSNEDLTPIFADTVVWGTRDGIHRTHFQRYPVINLTFKGVKARTWKDAWSGISFAIRRELERLWSRYGLGQVVAPKSAGALLVSRVKSETSDPADYQDILGLLVEWCATAVGEPAVILIDEYDAPLHAAWQHGYWDEAVTFFRAFFSGGLKDAEHLFRGALTGILRIAKEGIFSGLNNVEVRSLVHGPHASDFGFTETEVGALAQAAGNSEAMDQIRQWYNGYQFGGDGGVTVYNPWSVTLYLKTPEQGPLSFWKNSSSNDLIHEQLIRHAREVGPDVQRLIEGESIEKTIDDNVALPRLGDDASVLWSLLTFSGYLTPIQARPSPDGVGYDVTLRIPNREVRAVYLSVFSTFMRQAGDGSGLVESLLSGDTEGFHGELQDILLNSMSLYDFGRKPVEAVYQALIVGLLVQLQATHRVLSNREAGYGRSDVMIVPREPGPGAVLELKVVSDRETPERALERAAEQIQEREYAAEVRAAGATEVYLYAVVFDGKRCWAEPVSQTA